MSIANEVCILKRALIELQPPEEREQLLNARIEEIEQVINEENQEFEPILIVR